MIQKSKGMILAVVMMFLSIMLLLIYVLAQSITGMQRSISNYSDMSMAQNYALDTMLYAESVVYQFDLQNKLEDPPVNCQTAGDSLSRQQNNLRGASCIALRRAYTLQKLAGSINLMTDGSKCNQGNNYKGFCYKRITGVGSQQDTSFDSDVSWQPWAINGGFDKIAAPCDTFIRSSSAIPMIDDKTSSYSILYNVNNKTLCNSPRYIIEPINLDYRGNYVIGEEFGSGIIAQRNDATMQLYKISKDKKYSYNIDMESMPVVNSGRLYRITAVAYGRSGSTRAMLQEVVLINNYVADPDLQDNKRVKEYDTPNNFVYRIVRLSSRWL